MHQMDAVTAFIQGDIDEEIYMSLPPGDEHENKGTRPDITYVVNSLSRYNNQPTNEHWVALKRVMRYLKGTMNMKLVYKRNVDEKISGYCDSDWANDIEDRKSCTGYIFLFQGAAINCDSKKQQTIALSTSEAEYMTLASAIQEALWLKQLADEFQPELKGQSSQGSVLGPTLWNILLDDLLGLPFLAGVKTVTYADDVTVLVEAPSRAEIERRSNAALDLMQKWGERNRLMFSPANSCTMTVKGRLQRPPTVRMGGGSIRSVSAASAGSGFGRAPLVCASCASYW
ncbi:Copia protein [Eumeta japonica]|uniref:Copia protein n=1 Tax=Eumeta variegata TaxID=151549 RepID=A0A4C1ZRJ3_EUMVA|nr:Copia protein [Eumeta japonica]